MCLLMVNYISAVRDVRVGEERPVWGRGTAGVGRGKAGGGGTAGGGRYNSRERPTSDAAVQ